MLEIRTERNEKMRKCYSGPSAVYAEIVSGCCAVCNIPIVEIFL